MDRRKLKKHKSRHHSSQDKSAILQLFPGRDVPIDIYALIFEYLAGYSGESCMLVSKQWRAHFLQFVPRACASILPKRRISKEIAQSIRHLDIDDSCGWIDRTLLNFKMLRELDITIDVDPSAYKVIAKLTQLEALAINSIHHNDATLILRKLTGLKRLKVFLTDDKDIMREFDEEDEDEKYKIMDPEICPCNDLEKDAYTIEFFKALQKLTRLEHLKLKCRHLPVLPRHLSNLTRLTSLEFTGFDFPPCYPRHYSTLTNIEEFTTAYEVVNRYSAEQIQKHFAPFVKLTSLNNPIYFENTQNKEILDTDLFQRLTRLRHVGLITESTPITLPNIKHLKIFLPSHRVSNIAAMTALSYLHIAIETPPYDSFWQLTTLTNLQYLEFNGTTTDEDEQGKWNMICEYAKKMTRLSVVHFEPSFTMKSAALPYSWQRIEEDML